MALSSGFNRQMTSKEPSLNGGTPMVKLLLEAGAKAGIEDALCWAISKSYRDIKELVSETLIKTSPSKVVSNGRGAFVKR